MERKSKKGFMMAEVVIVSAIILVILVTMFMSFNKIYGSYKTKSSYFDAVSLFHMAYYRDIMIENDLINNVLDSLETSGSAVKVYDSICDKKDKTDDEIEYCGEYKNLFTLPSEDKNYRNNDVVYIMYTPDKAASINKDVFGDDNTIHAKFRDYIGFVGKAAGVHSNYVMFMERCQKTNINNCKYGYLEVYDE